MLAIIALPALPYGGNGGPAALLLPTTSGLGGFDGPGNAGTLSPDNLRGGGGGGGGINPITGLGEAGGAGGVVPDGNNGGAGGAGGNPGLVQTGGTVGTVHVGVQGGDGVQAAGASNASGSGGGGEGGAGVFLILDAVAPSAVTANQRGALGGTGGNANTNDNQYPGSGGDGGIGLYVRGVGNVSIASGLEMQGGVGGNGGAYGGAELLGRGGNGGAGLRLGTGSIVTNLGTLQGGNAGLSDVCCDASGGNGAFVTGGQLINFGTIAAGFRPDFGATRGLAIRFVAGDGAVELMNGSSVIGNVQIDPAQRGTIRLNGGTLSAATAPNVLNFGRALLDSNLASSAITSVITGPGIVEKTGVGEVTIADVNTYTGGTVVTGGTLTGTVSSFGSGDIETNAAVRVRTDAGQAAMVNRVSGSGVLIKSGAGRLDALLINRHTGGTVIQEGVMRGRAGDLLGENSAFGTGPIENNGELLFGSSVPSGPGFSLPTRLLNPVSGTGVMRKIGDSTLNLTGVNTFSGGTVIEGGSVWGSATSFGTGPILHGGVTIRLNQVTDGTMSNAISGIPESSIWKFGAGALTLTGNSDYPGTIVLKEGRINVGSNTALGTSVLTMDDGTALGFSADRLVVANNIVFTGTNDPTFDSGPFTSTLTGAISGAADMSKIGAGTLVLTGSNTYSGATGINEGTLRAGATNTLSAVSPHTVAANATLDLAGFSQSLTSLTNGGIVSLVGAVPGTRLTMSGPYVGSNGVLRLGTSLGDSSSASDRLVLDGAGASATGSTSVQIVNLGGLGGLTSGNGIEVISAVNGATTTAQSTRDAFSLAGSVAAGPYVYRLAAADALGAGENWYLRSTQTIPVVIPNPPGTVPPGGGGAGGAGGGTGGFTVVQVEVPSYRPEASLAVSLPSQLRQANLSMLSNRHQRMGDDDVTTAPSASTPVTNGGRRAWGRVLTTDPKIEQGGTLSTRSEGRLSGFQAGTDVWAAGAWKAGVYVGQLDGDMQVNGFALGQQGALAGSNDLRNRYVGGYVDWSGPDGWYGEAVLQAGRHRFQLKPVGAPTVKGKGKSLLASVEVGKAFEVAPGWKVEPQLQLIHQRPKFDEFNVTGAQVGLHAEGGVTIRAGVRVKGEIATDAGVLQPYARLNIYRQPSGKDSARFSPQAVGATTIDAPVGGTSTEIAGGFTLAVSPTTSIYGEVGKLHGSGGDAKVSSSLQGSLGVRVRW